MSLPQENQARRLEALARSFPTFRDRLPRALFAPDFKAALFCEFCRPMSGGEKDAALFVLSVWNPDADWAALGLVRGHGDNPMRGRFDVHRALGNWDRGHSEAFTAWAAAPWWC